MPTARGGSKPNGARGKPVTLVKIATDEKQSGPSAECLSGQQAVQHDKAHYHFDQTDKNVKFKKRHVNPPRFFDHP